MPQIVSGGLADDYFADIGADGGDPGPVSRLTIHRDHGPVRERGDAGKQHMGTTRPLPPIWLMGFGFLPLGVFGSIMLITTPQLLAALHVPEPRIASVEAIGLLPGFGCFILGPLLDWRYSRRFYALVFAGLGAACTFGALMMTRDLAALSTLLFAGNLSISLCVAAVGGWFGSLLRAEDKAALGAWFTVANLGGGGLIAGVAIYLLRDLPYALGAGIVGLLVVAAVPLYLAIPCPPADGRLASESFRDFARDVLALLRDPRVLWTLLLFAMPSASFALTNVLGGLGRDYHTSEKMVGLIGGAGVAVAGVVGSLSTPKLAELIPPRPLYLLVGVVGAAFTLLLIPLPRTSATFGLALLGENVFQAAAFSVANIITLRTIGEDNPLAATQFGLLTAATTLPLTYMQVADGQAYGAGGVAGGYLADALISGGACLLLAALLRVARRAIPAV
jgi:PAT family beta-lactamase induction signal transducer AmpG